jgi:hypothetical protein
VSGSPKWSTRWFGFVVVGMRFAAVSGAKYDHQPMTTGALGSAAAVAGSARARARRDVSERGRARRR